MNTEQANRISLREILKKIGFFAVDQKGDDFMYFSPFRKEKRPSFHVQAAKNIWFDFGEARGGNVVDFVCAWLENQKEDHSISDALRWLNNMQPGTSYESISKEEETRYGAPALELRKVASMQNGSLIGYLNSRGIPATLAKKYLREIHVRNAHTGKVFYAIGWPNENGGYELRNKFFKGSVTSKGISFIRGRKTMPEGIHVFEGFMDFLSALVHQKTNRFDGDAIILNSVGLLPQAFPYIRNYSYKTLYSWLDNDEAGNKALQVLNKFAANESLIVNPMNAIYADHKDVNAWHMHKLEL